MDILTTQKEAKLLPSDTFPGLKNYQNCFYGRGSAPEPAGGAYSAPPYSYLEREGSPKWQLPLYNF